MRWIAGIALMAMCAIGVIDIVVALSSGKTSPLTGIGILLAWLPLQAWYSFGDKLSKHGATTTKQDNAENGR